MMAWIRLTPVASRGGAGVKRVGELLFGAVDDVCVAKERVLRFRWDGVAPLEKEVFYVILDGQATCIDGIYLFSITTK